MNLPESNHKTIELLQCSAQLQLKAVSPGDIAGTLSSG